MDKVRVWWEELPEEVDIIMWSPRRWVAYVSYGDRRLCLFGATNRAAIASILVDFGDAISIDTANKALQVRHDSEIELFNLLSEEQKEAKPDA